MRRTATCACGQLEVVCEGDPVRISICHCRQCQKRTGSVFGVGAYFSASAVRRLDRPTRTFTRSCDAGRWLKLCFCPVCGSTVHWTMELRPGIVGVAVGAFADPGFPAPEVAVWAEHKAPWVKLPDDLPVHERAS